jgi:hypothetical protein
MNFVSLYLIFACLLFSACSHGPYFVERKVVFESSPTGAEIFVDGVNLGKTPFVGEVRRRKNPWTDSAAVTKLKAKLGECSDVKLICKGQNTPEKVFFDLSTCPKNSFDELPSDCTDSRK